MGTNYYLKKAPDLFGILKSEQAETLHIGKSSGGWVFSLRVHPEHGINSLRDWYRLFRKRRNQITNEYDEVISCQDMLDVIMKRSWHGRSDTFPNKWYDSEEQFLRQNQAVLGPNNLLRHRENSYTKHGPGTWDLIDQEFS